jgi:hypothetical protein
MNDKKTHVRARSSRLSNAGTCPNQNDPRVNLYG